MVICMSCTLQIKDMMLFPPLTITHYRPLRILPVPGNKILIDLVKIWIMIFMSCTLHVCD